MSVIERTRCLSVAVCCLALGAGTVAGCASPGRASGEGTAAKDEIGRAAVSVGIATVADADGGGVGGMPGLTEGPPSMAPDLDQPLEDNGRVTRFYRIKHVEGRVLAPIVRKWQSPEGDLLDHVSLNMLVITDTPERQEMIARVLERVDRLTNQAEIEIKVLEFKNTDEFEIGLDVGQVRLASNPSRMQEIRAVLNTPNDILGKGANALQRGGVGNWAWPSQDWTFDMLVRALAEKGYVDTLANPKVLVHSGETAKIEAITRIPVYQITVSANTTNIGTTFEEVGIKLQVTPRLIGTQAVVLHLKPEVSTVAGYTVPRTPSETTSPIISKRSAETVVDVRDGETLYLGGLKDTRKVMTVRGVPFLRSIPILGYAFSSKQVTDEKTEILVSLTLHIRQAGRPRQGPVRPTGEAGVMSPGLPPGEGEAVIPAEGLGTPAGGEPGDGVGIPEETGKGL